MSMKPFFKRPEQDEAGAHPENAPFGDGRDGPPLMRSVMQWTAGAGALLLLPRQYWAAGLCLLISGLFYAFLWRQKARGRSTDKSA